MSAPAKAVRWGAVALAVALAGGALVACGGGYEVTAEEQALLDDERYGPETFESGDYNADIEIDDGRLHIHPYGDGGDKGGLTFDYFGDTGEIQDSLSAEVREGSVVAFREYRARVVTIDDRGIAFQLAVLAE